MPRFSAVKGAGGGGGWRTVPASVDFQLCLAQSNPYSQVACFGVANPDHLQRHMQTFYNEPIKNVNKHNLTSNIILYQAYCKKKKE